MLLLPDYLRFGCTTNGFYASLLSVFSKVNFKRKDRIRIFALYALNSRSAELLKVTLKIGQFSPFSLLTSRFKRPLSAEI